MWEKSHWSNLIVSFETPGRGYSVVLAAVSSTTVVFEIVIRMSVVRKALFLALSFP